MRPRSTTATLVPVPWAGGPIGGCPSGHVAHPAFAPHPASARRPSQLARDLLVVAEPTRARPGHEPPRNCGRPTYGHATSATRAATTWHLWPVSSHALAVRSVARFAPVPEVVAGRALAHDGIRPVRATPETSRGVKRRQAKTLIG